MTALVDGRDPSRPVEITVCRPHQVGDAAGETEQQTHAEPPSRSTEQPVECPAYGGADNDAGHELGREPHPAGKARRFDVLPIPTSITAFTRPLPAEPIAEMPEPRGESSLIAGTIHRIVLVARLVGHVTPLARRP